MPLNLIKKLTRKVLGRGTPAAGVQKSAKPEPKPEPHRNQPSETRPDEAQGARRPRRRRKPAGSGGEASQPSRPHAAASRPAGPATAPVAAPAAEWSIEQFDVPPVEGKKRFHDFDLPAELMHAIADLEFRYCTTIQEKVLTHVKAGQNVAGRAQTGTGKTAAFLVLTMARFLTHPRPTPRPGSPRALVLAPTRELVIQIIKDANSLGGYTSLRSLAVYGGMDFVQQQRQLEHEVIDIVAATPGRLLDFINRGTINLRETEVLVIDEADRMLDMGFIPDVRRIIRCLPPKDARRTMLFSATLTDDVMRLASQWMPDPVVIEVEPEQVAVDTVEQIVYAVSSTEKFRVLYNLLRRPQATRVLIFGNRRDSTMRLADNLKRHGMACELLTGAVTQNRRLRILEDFREGKVPVVVATDVAGRGIHVDGISHVINYDFPYEAEDYVHRIGRTGRAGAAGTAISFACESESFIIPEIEKYIKRSLPCRLPEEDLLAALPRPNRAPSAEVREDSRYAPRRSGSSSGGRRRPPPRRR